MDGCRSCTRIARHGCSVNASRSSDRASAGRPRRPVPAGRLGLITRIDAHAAGWTDDAIRHAVGTGRWRRVARGVYWPAYEDPARPITPATGNLQRGVASALACQRAVLSHASAAILHGLPTVCDLRRPCLTVPPGTALRSLADAHLHRAALPPSDVVEYGGVRVTSVGRTVFDVAREHGIDAGVAAADDALNRGKTSADALGMVVSRMSGWRGNRAAIGTLRLCDGRSESALESISRLRIAEAGLPVPTLQARIGDRHGRLMARVDFYWPQFGVVGEADGNLKYDAGRDAIVAERRRQQRLEDLGLVVVRWEWSDLARFEIVSRRLRSAFVRGVHQGAGQRWSVL